MIASNVHSFLLLLLPLLLLLLLLLYRPVLSRRLLLTLMPTACVWGRESVVIPGIGVGIVSKASGTVITIRVVCVGWFVYEKCFFVLLEWSA
jgi:hypothetical protein